ncbi:MAG: hypothetical protein LBF66_01200 [Holosporales bacterium]|jgi:hypothetical protein|nr:hypothetical protein [Holosporales bacterium]
MKKSLLLGTLAAVLLNDGAQSQQVRFYVGVMGGGQLVRFNVINNSSFATGQKVSSQAAHDAGYQAPGGGDIPHRAPANVHKAELEIPSILAAAAGLKVVSNANAMRGSGSFFVGMSFPLGQQAFGGLEARITKVLGGLEYNGAGLTPNLKQFSLADDKKSVVPYKTDIAGKYFPVEVALSNKWAFDAVAMLGFTVPGSDGRLRVAVGGLLGVERLKFKFKQVDSGFYYFAGIADALLHAAKLEVALSKTPLETAIASQAPVEYGDKVVAATAASPAIVARYITAVYIRDFLYNMRKFNGISDSYKTNLPQQEGVPNPLQISQANAWYILEPLMYGAWTEEDNYYDAFKTHLQDPDVSSNNWVLHGGMLIRAEYNLSRNMFVLLELAAVRVRKVTAEAGVKVKSLSAKEIDAVWAKAITDGVFNDALAKLTYSGNEPMNVSTDSASLAELAKKVGDGDGMFSKGVSGRDLEMGQISYKFDCEKQWEYRASIGFGFRF